MNIPASWSAVAVACATTFAAASAAEPPVVQTLRPGNTVQELPAWLTSTSSPINGGDYERGRALFFGAQLKCSTCHRIRGEGGTNGPDLSILPAKDASSVLQDIRTPSASIHDGFVTYNVKLKDGEELSGLVRAQDKRMFRLVGADGKERRFARTDVKELRLKADSLMPAGLLDSLKGDQVNDLLTFLLNAPPSRSREEVQAALAPKASAPTPRPAPLHLVLIASKQDHGPGQHDYPAWQKTWHELLSQAPNVTVADAWLWPTEEQLRQAEVLVFYYWNREWNEAKLQQLDEFLARGGGMVVLHSAVIGNPDPPALAGRIGLSSWSGKTKYRHTPIDLNVVAPTDHPIMQGLPRQIRFVDEPYWPLVGDTNKIEVLATSELDGGEWPIVWTYQKGKGRIFVSVFGHYTWTLDDPLYRVIVLRAIGWAAGGEVRRLEGLVRE